MFTLPETKQEVFNIVVRGLASQQWEKSKTAYGCAYRGEHGRKCAGGWLIPDECYTPRMEQRSWETLTSTFVFPRAFREFIYSMQQLHDDAFIPNPQRLAYAFYKFAQREKLTWPEDVPTPDLSPI